MKLRSATSFGTTPAGGGAGGAVGVGNANASRSLDTDWARRVSMVPPTPLATPANARPRVANDNRLPLSIPSTRSFLSTPLISASPSTLSSASVIRPEVRNRSTAMAHPTPAMVGMRSAIPAPGRASTAAHPAAPPARIARLPTGMRERSQRAVKAATAAMTTSTITDKNSLSAVPKV